MATRFKYENVVLPRSPTFETEKGQPPRAVEVNTFLQYDDGRHEDKPELELLVDRDAGVSFWQAEGLEPSDFVGLMAIVHQGICEARGLMGENWEAEVGSERQFDVILTPQAIFGDGNPLRMRILVYPIQHVVGTDGAVTRSFADQPVLDGSVDWQNGILLGKTEDIEPADFVPIMATFHAGVWKARRMIGDSWIHGDEGEVYDPADAPTS